MAEKKKTKPRRKEDVDRKQALSKKKRPMSGKSQEAELQAEPIKRMQTGVPGLDEFLAGGIPSESAVLILGEPGTGKSTFCFNFIHEGLINKESCIVISTSDTPESVLSTMEAVGLDHIKSKDLLFIDCYSWRLGRPSKSKYSINQPNDLNHLSLIIDKAIGEGKPPYRFVFDSLSDIILHVEPDTAIKFIQVISAKIKNAGGVGLFTLEKGMHEEKYVNTIEYLSDGILEMYIEKENRYVKIKKMAKTLHTLKPILFTISGKKGMMVEIAEFFN